jgi:hypothetical protein
LEREPDRAKSDAFSKASLSAIRDHSRFLAKNEDLAGTSLNRFGESGMSHCVIRN